MRIRFNFLNKISLSKRTKLKQFIYALTQSEKTAIGDLDIVFCSDNYLLNINNEFLKHNYYTDIITFDLSSKHDTEKTVEIYISTERLKENANNFNTSLQMELHRVIFHGVLHICGYKDKSKADKKLMQRMENKYLNKYFK